MARKLAKPKVAEALRHGEVPVPDVLVFEPGKAIAKSNDARILRHIGRGGLTP